MAEPIGYIIRRPTEEAKGESIIFITRPSAGPFGGNGTAIFACTGIEVGTNEVRVQTEDGPVVFSKDLPFLLVPRSHAYPVTTKELAEQQLAEKKEWDAVYDADEAGALSAAVTMTDDGRQRNNPGQYL